MQDKSTCYNFEMWKRKTTVVDTISDLTKPIDSVVEHIERTVDSQIAPERESALKRFPRLFTLLVAFGVCTTYYGFEKLVDQVDFISTRPFIMLILGISILAITGTLYKKL